MTTINKILKVLLYCVIGVLTFAGSLGVWAMIKDSIIKKHAKKLEMESENKSVDIN